VTESTIVRPYGDTTGDGMVQLSFTLPIPHSKVAEGAAAQLAAIADGTFGSMKRPPTKGKGLDGVVVKADAYDNPATTLLEEGATR